MEKRTNYASRFLQSNALTDVLWIGITAMTIVLVNFVGHRYFFRLDLTEEQRYTLQPSTKALLRNLDETVYIDVFLDGKLNAAFTRLKAAVAETLEEFRTASDDRVQFEFTNPDQAIGEQSRREFMADLANRGITPTRVIDNGEGQRTEKIIFPGAIISVGTREAPVVFLKGNKAAAPEVEINQSIEGLEYELSRVINNLTNPELRKIGWVEGHGELGELEGASFERSLNKSYAVERLRLDHEIRDIHVLLIAKPTKAFTPAEKFRLDKYVMNGGRVLFLLDRMDATIDSASQENYHAFPLSVNLDDLLFQYGIRVNMDLVQDRAAAMQPVLIGPGGEPRLMDWPFFPLINTYSEHPITRNLDAVIGRFVSSLDTVKAVGVKKTVLMTTSPRTRRLAAPVRVSIDDLRSLHAESNFNEGPLPLAFLLEGSFTSLFKNRFVPEGITDERAPETSVPTAMVVIADGDLARNPINPRTGNPQPLGFDPPSNYTFANEELLLNSVSYLLDDEGLIAARSKQIRLRPLDRQMVEHNKTFIRVVNIGIPLILTLLLGALQYGLRKRRYGA